METHEIFVIAMTIAVLAADAFIRLRIAPARRDRFVERLLHPFAK